MNFLIAILSVNSKCGASIDLEKKQISSYVFLNMLHEKKVLW